MKKALGSAFGVLSFFLLSATPVAAQINTTVPGLALGDRNPIEIILYLMSWFLGILALIVVVLIIYAGFLWMTSGGNADRVKTAKQILKNALIGLLIILASWGIVLWLIGIFSDATGTGAACDPTVEDCSGDDDCIGCIFPSGGSDFYVLSTNPEAGQENVYVCTDITVRMSEYVDTDTVNSQNWFLQVDSGKPAASSCTVNNECASALCSTDTQQCAGDTVAGVIGFGPGDNTKYFNFIPSVDLEKDTLYRATVKAPTLGGLDGIYSTDEDAGGEEDNGIDDRIALENDYIWTFSTGQLDDNIPPTVVTNGQSPMPADGETNVCTNTVINFDFSESMRVTTFNDDQSFVLDDAGTEAAPVTPDWLDLQELKDWTFGGDLDYASVRPKTTLQTFSQYSTRLYAGDPANNFAGALTDSCGNALDAEFVTGADGAEAVGDGVADGAPIDNFYGFDAAAGESEDPITWLTGENAQCTPVVESFTPTVDYYGEFETDPTLEIHGLYLTPHPEIRFEGSAIWASGDFNTCFDPEHLGNLESDTSIGNACVDDDVQTSTQLLINTAVGTGMSSPVQVTVAEEQSEPTATTLAVYNPYIELIDPKDGSAGQYITVRGANYGDAQGTSVVVMRSADGARESRMELPTACGTVWANNELVVIAPERYQYTDPDTGSVSEGEWQTGDVTYVQVVNAGVAGESDDLYSDLQRFEYSDTVRPNLCSVEPNCSASGGATFTATGDHFGATQNGSQVAFANGSGDSGYNASIASWADTLITGTTSTEMGQHEYWTTVYDAATQLNSNGRTYSIPCNTGPHVLDINSCDQEQSIYPTPNPRPNETDACINASIGVLFDQEMDRTTFQAKNIYLEQYNQGGSFDSGFSALKISSFTFEPWSAMYNNTTYEGFQFNPSRTPVDADKNGKPDGNSSTYLQPNTWYQLTITTEVKNKEGVSLSAPYTLRFRTKDSTELCAVDTVDTQPTKVTKNTYWDTTLEPDGIAYETFTSSPYNEQCQLLDADSYAWEWLIDKTEIANFGIGAGTTHQQNTYVAGDDEENEGTARVTAGIADTSVDDTASFTVDLGFCTSDDDCAACGGSTCDLEMNHCSPVVQSIDPLDGAVGTWVTVNGCMFGSSKGNVYWNNGNIHAQTAWPDAQQCGDTWTADQIVVEVPAEYDTDGDGAADTTFPKQNYNIEVETKYGGTDESESDFTVNDTQRPGLCKIEPNKALEGGATTAYGKTLGSEEGYASFLSPNDYVAPDGLDRLSADGSETAWTDRSISTVVPYTAVTGLQADGKEGFTAIVANNEGDDQCVNSAYCSNSLDFIVSCTSDYDCDGGECTEAGICVTPDNWCDDDSDCATQCPGAPEGAATCENNSCSPVILGLSPTAGPYTQPVSVSGCFFGSYKNGISSVTFDTVLALLACEDKSWSNSLITVVVPSDAQLPDTLSTVQVHAAVSGVAVNSNTTEFVITEQCYGGADIPDNGIPTLCDITPMSGPAATEDGATAGERVELEGKFFDTTADAQEQYFYTIDDAPEDDPLDADPSDNKIAANNTTVTSDTLASAEVPYGATTFLNSGEATTEVRACPSNALDFGVTCETADDCANGAYCIDGICIGNPGAACGECTDGNATQVCGSQNGCYFDESQGVNCCGALPYIVSTTPEDGDKQICPNSILTIEFSEAMNNLNTDNITVQLVEGDAVQEQHLPLSMTVSADFKTVSITPDPGTGLATSAVYQLTIKSDDATGGVEAQSTGLLLRNGTETIQFNTEKYICSPDEFTVTSDETGDAYYLFTAPDLTTNFTAHMYASNGQEIVSTETLGWEYAWQAPYYDAQYCSTNTSNVAWLEIAEDAEAADDDTPAAAAATQTVRSGSENNGSVSVVVTATGTTPAWVGQDQATASVDTFYDCPSGSIWSYYDTDGVAHAYPQQFRLLYCKDGLPDLETTPTMITRDPEGGDWFLQYLFYDQDDKDQAFALRVYRNEDRLSPEAWYRMNINPDGSPKELTIDGYAAVQDGLTYYISASIVESDSADDADTLDELNRNMYVFTFNQEDDLLQIGDQIITYLQLNKNLDYNGCEGSQAKKIRRDTQRINDIGTIEQLANDYYAIHSEYPKPQSADFGSYISNFTTSVWSSWQGALGNLFSQTLPTDPYNFFYSNYNDDGTSTNDPWNADGTPWDDELPGKDFDCSNEPEQNKYYDEAGTCWDPINNQFFCPEASQVYAWKVDPTNGDAASLYGHFEYDGGAYTEDFINSDVTINACNDLSPSQCACFNYGITSSGNPGGEWSAINP